MVGKDTFIGLCHLAHLADAEVGFHLHAGFLLEGVDFVVEDIALDALGHTPALQETTIGIPHRPGDALVLRNGFGNLIVQAHIQESVHRTRHRDGRTRTHRDEQRILRLTKLAARDAFQLLDVLANHAVNLGTQLRDSVDSLVAAEGLGGNHKARRHRHPVQVQVLQVVGLVADEHLVVHLGCLFPERAYQHLGVVGHDVADKFLVQSGFHVAQRSKDAADEVVQRLHQESVREQVTVELFRFAADEGHGLAFAEFPFGVEELRDDDFQRVFV